MFNLTSDYTAHVKPVLDELERQCQLYGLPLFATIAYADDGNKTSYDTKMLSATASSKELTDDKLPSHLLIMLKGFRATPSNDAATIQDGDVTIEM